jgi:spermidine/putrescine transport system substrate-binding protein
MRSEFDALMGSSMGRRALLKYMGVGAAAVGGSGILAACRKDAAPAGSPSVAASDRPTIEEEPGVLKAYTWSGYELKPLWKDYAAAGYQEPKFSFFTNTEQALAKTAGGYSWDTAHPEIGYIQDYLNIESIQPWDTSLISNFDQLNPMLEAAGQVNGQQYEIVTDWGYSGVIIRSDKLDPSINSYSYLFDDAAAGHISWFDTPWILQQAGLVLGVPGEQTFDMTAEQLEECKNYCIDRKKNLLNIWVDFNQMWDDVRQGNVWAAYSWPDTFAVLNAEGVPVEYIKPKEGVLSWAEGLVLNADTENYLHAHEYADSWADAGLGLWLINNYGYGHANLNVDLDKVDPEVVRVFGLEDPETALSEPNSYIDRYQPNRAAYNRAWDEVKAA